MSEFRICVSVSNGVQGCSQGYNSEEKKPETVNVNIHNDLTYLAPEPQQEQQFGQSQSQSQSDDDTIIICNEPRCEVVTK